MNTSTESAVGTVPPWGDGTRTSPRDMIFVSMEDWDEIWRRNQFVCAGLARRHPDKQILFVGLPRDYSHRLRTGNFHRSAQPMVWKVPEFPNITVLHPAKLFPNTYSLGRRLNEVLLRWSVGRMAAKLGLVRPLLWLNPHSACHMVGKMNEDAVIYDITDDWLTPTQDLHQTALIREQDRTLCQSADAVIVCSEQLQRLKAPFTEFPASHPQRCGCFALPKRDGGISSTRPGNAHMASSGTRIYGGPFILTA